MKTITSVLIFGLAAFAVSACSHSIYRNEDIGKAEVMFTDAKQSASIAKTAGRRFDGKELSQEMIACAARSPDVFSAISSAFEGKADVSGIGKLVLGLSGAGSSSEAAASFGLRSQLTQTQIELLYRLCEASFNGSLDSDALEKHLRRFQTTMVAMLAIEQITGVAKPTIFAIGGQSAVGEAQALLGIQTVVDTAQADVDKKQAAANSDVANVTSAQKAYDDAKAAADKAPNDTTLKTKAEELKTKLDEANSAKAASAKKLAYAKENLATVTEMREKIKNSTNAGSSTSAPTLVQGGGQSSPAAGEPSPAKYATDIAIAAINRSFLTEECIKYLFSKSNQKTSDLSDADRIALCKSHFDSEHRFESDRLYLTMGCGLSVTDPAKDVRTWNCPVRTTADHPPPASKGENAKQSAENKGSTSLPTGNTGKKDNGVPDIQKLLEAPAINRFVRPPDFYPNR